MNRLYSLLALLLIIASILTPIPATITQARQPPQVQQNPSLPIAIIGDYSDDIKQFLEDNGYNNILSYSNYEEFETALDGGQDYSVAIFNRWSSSLPGSDDVVELLQKLDDANIPVIWLDSYGTYTYYGGYILYYYHDEVAAAGYPAPDSRYYGYSSWGGYDEVYVDQLDPTHDIFDGVTNDPYYTADSSASYANEACYASFDPDGPSVTELGHLYNDDDYHDGMSVVEWTDDDGEKWIFISYGATYYNHYYISGGDGPFSDDAKQVFLNAVEYAIASKPPVQYGLVKGYVWDADTGDPIEDALVCSGAICDTTDATGYYELNLTARAHNVTASKLGYFKNTTEVNVPADGETWANFTLEKKPLGNIYVAVIGDLDNDIYDFLDQNYSVVSYENYTEFLAHIDDYPWNVVVINIWADSLPDSSDVINFLQQVDSRDIALIILDTYRSYTDGYKYWGGYVMSNYHDDIVAAGYPAPSSRDQDYWSTYSYVYVHATKPSHPIFNGVSYDAGTDKYYISYDYARYARYEWDISTVDKIGFVYDTSDDSNMSGIILWRETTHNNGGEYWVFISYGANFYFGYTRTGYDGMFTDNVKKVFNNTVYWAATTREPAVLVKIYGYVKDANTGDPIEGATVRVVETGASNTTDASGYYEVKVEPDNTYTLRVTHPDYLAKEETVTVGDTDIEHNITLYPKPPYNIAIIGDLDNDIYDYLSAWWRVYSFENYSVFMDSVLAGNTYHLAILNTWSSTLPSEDDVVEFLKIMDMHNIPLLILDTYTYGSYEYYGGYVIYYYDDEVRAAGYPAPVSKTSDYEWTETYVFVNVSDPSHPIFDGVSYDAGTNSYYIKTIADGYVYYAYYDWSGVTGVTVLAQLNDTYYTPAHVGAAIAEWTATGGEKWVFISYGANYYHGYSKDMYYYQFSDNAKKVFNNTVDYLVQTYSSPGTFTIYGYVYNESSGLPLENATVYIEGLRDYYNTTTDATGYYELTIPAGIDKVNVTAEYPKFIPETEEVTVTPGGSVQVDFYLEPYPPTIAIVGDYALTNYPGKHDIELLLENYGWNSTYNIEVYDTWEDLYNVFDERNIIAVIMNSWGSDPGATGIVEFLDKMNETNTTMIFLSGGSSSNGMYYLYQYNDELWAAGYPAPSDYDYYIYYAPTGENLYIKMADLSHTIYTGIKPDTGDMFYVMKDLDQKAPYYGYVFPAGNITVLGYLEDTYNGKEYNDTGEWVTPAGAKWMFLGHGAATYYVRHNEEGYYNQFAYKTSKLVNNTLCYILGIPPYGGEGYIKGWVKENGTGTPIAGATVTIVELNMVNTTDANGYYEFWNVTVGTYTILVEHSDYISNSTTVTVKNNLWSVANVTLAPRPPTIGLIGDRDDNDIKNLLESWGYYVESYSTWSDFLDKVLEGYDFEVVLINEWSIDGDELVLFLTILDMYNIPIIFLDGYSWGYGGYQLYSHREDVWAAGYPAPNETDAAYPYLNYSDEYVRLVMINPTHQIFNGVTPDDDNYIYPGNYSDQYFDFRIYKFPEGNVTVLAEINASEYNWWYYEYEYYRGVGIAEWTADGGEKWLFFSIGASYDWVGYSSGSDNTYSDKFKQILHNAIEYAKSSKTPPGTATIYGYVREAGTLNPIEGAEVYIKGLYGYYNTTTDATGYYELTIPAGKSTATLCARKSGYLPSETLATGITDGASIEVDFTLEPVVPSIVVIGDYEDDIKTYLEGLGYTVTSYDDLESFMTAYENNYVDPLIVIVNRWGSSDPGAVAIINFLDAMNESDIPIAFLGYSGYYTDGIYRMYYHRNSIRAEGYIAPTYTDWWPTTASYVYMKMLIPTHCFFYKVEPDVGSDRYRHVTDLSGSGYYRYVEFDPSDPVVIVANVTDEYRDLNKPIIAVWTEPTGGEKWVFFGHGGSYYVRYATPGGYNNYTDNAKQVFINIINTLLEGKITETYKLFGYVVDAVTLEPLAGAAIGLPELGLSTTTNSYGYYEFTNVPVGCHVLIVDKAGYYSKSINITIGVWDEEYNVTLMPKGNATIEGFVLDSDTGTGIAGATVKIIELGLTTTTNSTGGFKFEDITPGRYHIEAIAPKYIPETQFVVAPANETTIITFSLSKYPPTIAIVGDYEDDLKTILEAAGYTNIEQVSDWRELIDKLSYANYILVIFNYWGSTPSLENVTTILDLLNESDIPVIFLDTGGYGYTGYGAYYLYYHSNQIRDYGYVAPTSRISDYWYSDTYKIYYKMLCPGHPLFNGVVPSEDEKIYIINNTDEYVSYAAYKFEDTRYKVLAVAWLYDERAPKDGVGIAIWVEPTGGERWIFIGAGASHYRIKYNETGYYNMYSENAKKILLNAIEYALTYKTIPSSTLTVKVYDPLYESYVENANVTIIETGDWKLTNAAGEAVFTVFPATYTINVSKTGYRYNVTTISVCEFENPTIEIWIMPTGTGYITGKVVDSKTGEPVEGATVRAGAVTNTTNAAGEFILKVDVGIYTVYFEHLAYFSTNVSNVKVFPDTTTDLGTIAMERKPPILAIVGDIDNDLYAFLSTHTPYYIESYDDYTEVEEVIDAGADFIAIIIDQWGSTTPSSTEVIDFLEKADTRNISLIFLDSSMTGRPYGGYVMYQYHNSIRSAGYAAPINRVYGYPNGEYTYIEMLNKYHKIFDGVSPDVGTRGYRYVTDLDEDADYSIYEFAEEDLVDVIGVLHDTYNDRSGAAIAIWYPEGYERWVFISYGANYWSRYNGTYWNSFSDNAKKVLLNTIEYVQIHVPKLDLINFTVTPYRVYPGTEITVKGVAMIREAKSRTPYANKSLTIYIFSTYIPLGTVMTDALGRFGGTFTIPEDIDPGLHGVGAGDTVIEIYIGPDMILAAPVPELPILPMILLAAILLMILVKKRR